MSESGKRKLVWTISCILLILTLVALDYFGVIWHNEIFAFRYPVKGLDVSHHQKKIDWAEVKTNHNFYFVFMKATEGHDQHKVSRELERGQKAWLLHRSLSFLFYEKQRTGTG